MGVWLVGSDRGRVTLLVFGPLVVSAYGVEVEGEKAISLGEGSNILLSMSVLSFLVTNIA